MLKTNEVDKAKGEIKTDIDILSSTESLLHFSNCESFTEKELQAMLAPSNIENTYDTYDKLYFSTKLLEDQKTALKKHHSTLFKIKYPEEFFNKINDNKYFTLFGFDNYSNELVCFAVIDVRLQIKTAEILSLGVVKEYQGYKVGSTLLKKIIDELTVMGIIKIKLTVSATNFPAIKLYSKFGFYTYREDKFYYRGLENDDMKALFMLKEIIVKKFWLFEVFRKITRRALFNLYCKFCIYN